MSASLCTGMSWRYRYHFHQFGAIGLRNAQPVATDSYISVCTFVTACSNLVGTSLSLSLSARRIIRVSSRCSLMCSFLAPERKVCGCPRCLWPVGTRGTAIETNFRFLTSKEIWVNVIYIYIYIYIYIQDPPKKCTHTLKKENSTLYNRLL